ncbi:MAG: PIN domain-containing protein [Myxococcales bacterium]|nr:PIN domain-containing protein [Myxococcales bacterium]
MTAFVADTHALLWHLMEPRRLGRGARRAFAAADAGRTLCYVPAIVLVEAWLLHERGRTRVGAAQVLATLAAHPGYSLLPLDAEQVVEFGGHPAVRDPMDRLILCAALVTGSKLVSADGQLGGQGVEVVWD